MARLGTGLMQGFPVPTNHAEHTIHDTNELPQNTVGVRITVSAATPVVMTMTDEDGNDEDVTYHLAAAGERTEWGFFTKVKATGTTGANLLPANKVVALVVR